MNQTTQSYYLPLPQFTTTCSGPTAAFAISTPVNNHQQYHDNTIDYRPPQISAYNNVPQPQDAIMVEYKFFYKACNDSQIYYITCKEISFDVASHLLRNHKYLIQPSNLHVF